MNDGLVQDAAGNVKKVAFYFLLEGNCLNS